MHILNDSYWEEWFHIHYKMWRPYFTTYKFIHFFSLLRIFWVELSWDCGEYANPLTCRLARSYTSLRKRESCSWFCCIALMEFCCTSNQKMTHKAKFNSSPNQHNGLNPSYFKGKIRNFCRTKWRLVYIHLLHAN